MKKKLLAIAAIAIMIPLVLCACKKETPVEPTQPATQEVTVEPETKSSAPTEDPQAAVFRLMDAVNVLQYVACVSLDCDEEDVYYDEQGYAYLRVTDPDFQSIGDIWVYLFQTFTPDGSSAYYPSLAYMGQDGYTPSDYTMVRNDPDLPDGLYELQAWNGFSTYTIISDVIISNQSEQGFTADFTAEYFGSPVNVTIIVVADADSSTSAPVWKIDSIIENW